MDKTSEEHLSQVHPELGRRIRQLADECEKAGFPILVTCGVRSYADQDALYSHGRAEPGRIVTNAKGGESAHQFGYAADIVPGKEPAPEFTPDWDAASPEWKEVLTLARSCGLAEGAQWRTFPDRPHLFLDEIPAEPTDEMRTAFANGGMASAWELFAHNYNVPSA